MIEPTIKPMPEELEKIHKELLDLVFELCVKHMTENKIYPAIGFLTTFNNNVKYEGRGWNREILANLVSSVFINTYINIIRAYRPGDLNGDHQGEDWCWVQETLKENISNIFEKSKRVYFPRSSY